MKWAETIRLRSSNHNRQIAVELLQNELPEIASVPYLVRIELFLHATISSDACLALSFEGPQRPEEPHDLSLKLAAAVAEYGLVEHATWFTFE